MNFDTYRSRSVSIFLSMWISKATTQTIKHTMLILYDTDGHYMCYNKKPNTLICGHLAFLCGQKSMGRNFCYTLYVMALCLYVCMYVCLCMSVIPITQKLFGL